MHPLIKKYIELYKKFNLVWMDIEESRIKHRIHPNHLLSSPRIQTMKNKLIQIHKEHDEVADKILNSYNMYDSAFIPELADDRVINAVILREQIKKEWIKPWHR